MSDKVELTCQFLADTYGVKPGRTWGSLKDLDLRTFWSKNSCDTKVKTLSTPPRTAKIKTHAYIADWSDLQRTDLLSKIDVIINAFWSLDAHGDVVGRNKPREQALAKLGRPQVLAAVGGWGSSTPFSNLFASPTSRLATVLSLGAAVDQAKWHGIDLDWEYPETDDEFVNLLLFVAEYRLHWPLHLVSMAVPATPNSDAMRRHVSDLGNIMDFLHVMTYDFTGSWTTRVAPVSGVSESKASLAGWALVPKPKIFLGSAWYGRIMRIQDGKAVSWEDLAYKDAAGRTEGWTQSWMDGCTWASSPNSSEVATWEGTRAVSDKMAFVKENGFGGIFCWEWSQDNGDLARTFLA